jgi:hypothetical protein
VMLTTEAAEIWMASVLLSELSGTTNETATQQYFQLFKQKRINHWSSFNEPDITKYQFGSCYGLQSSCFPNFMPIYIHRCKPGWLSRYGDLPQAGRSGDRIPVGDRPDRPWGLPSLLYNGYRLSFPGLKRPGRGVDHPPHPAPRLKKK